MATRREIFQTICRSATKCYPEEEARQIAEMILEHHGVSRNNLFVEPNATLDIPDLEHIIEQIEAWRPVQYIIGQGEFMDMSLEVAEGVLIPRPETEELIYWIASEHKQDIDILDIGTGSGCIAIALARAIKSSRVWAMDISTEALAIARRNAARYAPEVQFVEGDALADFSTHFDNKFDIIVSNPPYIPASDRALMRPNVTEYEPHRALFVADDDPLIFYRAIARTARKMLKSEGRLYFEIYELLSEEMRQMLSAEGYTDIVVREDFRGKQRMVCARVSSTTR
jgi:release factor glutamine methyltransferase